MQQGIGGGLSVHIPERVSTETLSLSSSSTLPARLKLLLTGKYRPSWEQPQSWTGMQVPWDSR